ncbi:MAG: hypothetical protein AUI10_00810 [Actinobacteria bacterium 13_2_20CM_2_72_6]|nr:MAG: hypothetical protein AUI10_00810 [Actinobacteria bacterium 13_2_20CM_2_72_6]
MVGAVDDLLVEALFVSYVQPSDIPTSTLVHRAITDAIVRYGTDGCAARVALEFGDHPDTAVCRMAWARQIVHASYPSPDHQQL